MNFLVSIAHAQEAAAAAPQQSSFMSFVPIIAIFIVFYFLMIKPQKKRLDDEKRFLSQLKKGDEVFTKSGVIGKIYGLTEKVVTLEVADNVRLKFLRSQIGGSSESIFKTEEKKS